MNRQIVTRWMTLAVVTALVAMVPAAPATSAVDGKAAAPPSADHEIKAKDDASGEDASRVCAAVVVADGEPHQIEDPETTPHLEIAETRGAAEFANVIPLAEPADASSAPCTPPAGTDAVPAHAPATTIMIADAPDLVVMDLEAARGVQNVTFVVTDA